MSSMKSSICKRHEYCTKSLYLFIANSSIFIGADSVLLKIDLSVKMGVGLMLVTDVDDLYINKIIMSPVEFQK